MRFDTPAHLPDNTPDIGGGVKEDVFMRELSRSLGFVAWIIAGGVAAGIFHAYLTLDGWSLSLALVLILMLGFSVAGWRSVKRHVRTLRLERVFAGQCLRCGYDLRINPGRCPECGNPTIARTGRTIAHQ
jgi:hypothetical protein